MDFANNSRIAIDVHHYVDGGPKAKQTEIEAIIKESGVPYTSIVLREENYGVGRNLIGARRDLFDVHGYERVILIEDDLIPGPNFIKTTLSLADWAREYADIGMVQVWNLPQQPVSEDVSMLLFHLHITHTALTLRSGTKSRIRCTNTNDSTWMVAYTKKDWRAIRKRFMKPRYSKLERFVKGRRSSMQSIHIHLHSALD